jgi:hypothetical protein
MPIPYLTAQDTTFAGKSSSASAGFKSNIKMRIAGCHLLMRIILATWEAEIRLWSEAIQANCSRYLISKTTREKCTGGPSGSGPVLQLQNPEFKPQSHQKTKTKQ